MPHTRVDDAYTARQCASIPKPPIDTARGFSRLSRRVARPGRVRASASREDDVPLARRPSRARAHHVVVVVVARLCRAAAAAAWKSARGHESIEVLYTLIMYNILITAPKKYMYTRPMPAARAGTPSRDATRAPSSDARERWRDRSFARLVRRESCRRRSRASIARWASIEAHGASRSSTT